MKLPSGMTTAQLREHCEHEIVKGVAESAVLVRPVDLLALLVAMDLRERLDPDVQLCARELVDYPEVGDNYIALDHKVVEAAQRVLKHEPKPDLSKAPS